jgi:hypothetical protein
LHELSPRDTEYFAALSFVAPLVAAMGVDATRPFPVVPSSRMENSPITTTGMPPVLQMDHNLIRNQRSNT